MDSIQNRMEGDFMDSVVIHDLEQVKKVKM